MSSIVDLANRVFRDYVTDGMPSSGPWWPLKSEIRDLFEAVEGAIGGPLPGYIQASGPGLDPKSFGPANTLDFRMIRRVTEATDAAKAVTSITKANPGVMTVVGHGFSTGNRLKVLNPTGMTELQGSITITVLTADTFSIGVDTTTYSTANSTATVAKYNNGIQVEFDNDMPAGWTTSSSVFFRVYGADGATHLSHRANNWSGGVLSTTTMDPAASTCTISVGSPALVVLPDGYPRYIVGTPVKFSTTGVLPSPIVAGTTYYVVSSPGSNNFRFAASVGGSAINTTTSGSGVHTVTNQNSFYPGGDAQAITRVTDRICTLNGATWKARSTDPDPVFICGWAYTGDVDAWPTIVAAHAYIAGTPFSKLTFGLGVFKCERADALGVDGGLEMPAFSTIEGQGPNLSIICRGDYFNSTPFRFYDGKVSVRNIGQIGNAMFNGTSHGWKATARSEVESIDDISYENVWNWAIPGYNFNNGHPGGKNRLTYKGIRCRGGTNDIGDHKGEQNYNPDGAYGSTIEDFIGVSGGMGTVGRNWRVPVTLTTTNPIHVTNGSTDFTVALPFVPYVGQRIVFYGTVADVGNFSFANAGFTVKSYVRATKVATCSYDGVTTASATTGDYGGSGLTISTQTLNKGKPLTDLRAEGWRVNNCLYIDLFGYSQGLRFRGGDGNNVNGKGAHRSTVTNYIAITLATMGDDTDGEEFKALSTFGANIKVDNFYARSYYGKGGTAVLVMGGSDGSEIDAIVEGFDRGVYLVSNNTTIRATVDGGYDTNSVQVQVDGGQGDVPRTLHNCFFMTAGSSVVTLIWPQAPSFLNTGKHISVLGAELVGGIANLNGDQVVTKTATDTFTFDCGQVATETTPDTGGGGENILVTALNVQTPNSGNVLELRSRNAPGKALYLTNRCAGFHLLTGSSWDGSGTSSGGISYDSLATGIILDGNAIGFDCGLTYARLPTAAAVGNGAKALVTDSSTATFLGAISGGGSNKVPATVVNGAWVVVKGA